MADTALQLDMVNDALVGIGAKTISQLPDANNDGYTAAGAAAKQRYERSVGYLLSRHKWEFATIQVQLSKLSAVPLFDYASAFLLPTSPQFVSLVRMASSADTLNVSGTLVFPRAMRRPRFAIRTIKQAGTRRLALFSDFDDCFITYVGRVSETLFPPHFAECVVLKLKAELTLALSDSEDRAKYFLDELEGVAGRAGVLRRAIITDSANAPNPGIIDDAGFVSGR